MKMTHKEMMHNKFNEIGDDKERESILSIMADFHIRNGAKNNIDDSVGEIKITPKEFLDVLAHMLP